MARIRADDPRKEFTAGEGLRGRASDGERVRLARILRHIIKHQEPFNSAVFAQEEERMKRQKLARLHNFARSLNGTLVPNPRLPSSVSTDTRLIW